MGRTLRWLRIAVLLAVTPLAGRTACAQTPGTPLPDEPAHHPSQRVSGTVTDPDGDWIPNAQVTLASVQRLLPLTTVTDDEGRFSFTPPTAGDLSLTIEATGFAPSTQLLTLRPGQQLELAPTSLAVALRTDVQVTVSPHEIAQEEMHEEEKQRLLGVLPNFFVVYDWHAPPLSTRQKFELSWKSTLDPTSFVVAGGIAGVQQSQNDFSGYGQGAKGYGKRYGAAFADQAVGNMVGGAILPSLLHQDPRYFYMGTGTIRHRALYALAAAVICRGDNGRWQPNYSSVLGDLTAGAISNLYYPSTDRNGVGLTFENGLLGVVGDAVNNVIEEFVFRHITTNTHH